MTGNGSESNAAYYPIRVVSSETGINAITLRAWERRYGLITPKRTAKGHRLYTEQDIRLIKQIVALLDKGIPISQAQAMIANGDGDSAQLPGLSDKPSQWSHYREQLQQAVNDFDDYKASRLFEEISQFFPVDVALRFLFIPYYEQLLENRTRDLGTARLSFYTAFLQSRMAWRLSDPSLPQSDTRILVANCTRNPDIELLMMSLLLRQLDLGITRLAGLSTISSLIELLNSTYHWPVAVIQIDQNLSAEELSQIRRLPAETGCPVFVCGQHSSQETQLRQLGLIPLGQELQQSALTVRDMVQGMIS